MNIVEGSGRREGLSFPVQVPEAARRSSLAYRIGKRLMDVLLAGIALVLLLPVMALIGLLVRLTSRGPAIFCQERVGKNGRPFTMYKFRSMYIDRSDDLHRAASARYIQGQTLVENASSTARYKLQADPRVTRVGRVLRRTSFDEVPQLWNVVCGEMSLVGPRPPLAYEVALYKPHHMARLSVVPGLTGLWQVRGRSQVTFEEMMALDLEYIARQSLVLDLRILLATLPAVLSRRGAA